MRRPLVYIALFFMGVIFLLDSFFGVKLYDEGKLPEHEGRNVSVWGTVLSCIEKDREHIRMTVRVSGFKEDGSETDIFDAPENLLVDVYGGIEGSNAGDDAGVMPGVKISLRGEISLPESRRNPGVFDYRQYLKTRKIYAVMKADRGSLETYDVRDHIRFAAGTLRSDFLTKLEKQTDRATGALAEAMLFGDKSGLDEEQYEKFRKNGTAHILAVSGLHIGAIYGLIRLLWRGRKRWAFSLFTSSFLVFYCFLADFSPSVVRAVIMIIIHIVAKLLYRRYDILTAAALTAMTVLFVSPMQIYNTGFQMSFLAVMLISSLTPLTGRGMAGKTAFMFLFQLVMLPYTAYTFNYISLGAFVINIPVILIAGVMVPIGAVMMLIVDHIPETLFEMLGGLFSGCAELLIKINDVAYRPGILCFDTVSPRLWIVLLFYGAFFILASEMFLIMKSRKKWWNIFCVAALTVLISAGAGSFADDTFRDAEIVFVDVGQGDCMHMRVSKRAGADSFPWMGEYNVLIDGGGKTGYDVGKKVLKPYLLKNGVYSIDLAIVTHLHTDHYEGIRSLCRDGMVRKLCIYEGYKVEEKRILSECSLDKEDLIYVTEGDVLKVGQAGFCVLAPEKRSDEEYVRLSEDEEDENKKSLLIKSDYKGISTLMTGDIGVEGEDEVMKRMETYKETAGDLNKLKCDILKVGHHGSRYSTGDKFLDAADPMFAVIQVGKNNYGHPAEEILEKLEKRGIRIYRTDQNGAVGIDVKDNKIKAGVMIKSWSFQR